LGFAGYILRALGQKQKAIQALRAGVLDSINHENWKEAAINAGNLSELYIGSGDLFSAVQYGKEAVVYADKSEDELNSIASRAALADALYRTNKMSAAKNMFIEAELMQQSWQPKFQYLYSLRGFLFCEFLLEQGNYSEVLERAEITINIATERKDPLSIALDNLSLGRGNFYQQLDTKTPDFNLAKKYFDKAVDGLRIADRQDHIARSLLSRSELFRKIKDYENAQNDLDEAFEIAESGGMELQLVDCYLESAHLYLVMDKHEEAKKNIELAENSIAKTGYFLKSKNLEKLKRELIQ